MFGVIISKFMCGWKDGRCTVYFIFATKGGGMPQNENVQEQEWVLFLHK